MKTKYIYTIFIITVHVLMINYNIYFEKQFSILIYINNKNMNRKYKNKNEEIETT